MKKIRLLFLTLVALLGTVTASASKTVYIQPGAWSNDNAVISLYIWQEGQQGLWWTASNTFTEVETGIFKATFDDAIDHMKITRGNLGNTWTKQEGETQGYWNQTADMAISDGKIYKLYDYGNSMDGIYVGHGVVEEDYTEPVAAGYVCDFNTAITTSSHDFQVASNWRHIVGTYKDYWGSTSYPSYSYSETDGVDGSGALSCITNQSSNSLYDLLVTPVVKGTVTIDAKTTTSYDTPQLSFYKIIDNGDGTYSRGNQITVDVSAINTTSFTTITIPVDEAGERIGIRSSYVWLDNFTATEATIIPESKITITSAVPSDVTGTIYWEQQPNGKVLVSYTVTVKNTGEVDLTQGDEDFSVSIINGSTGEVYATVDVPQDLAIGETSKEFVVSAELETSLWPNSYTYINMNLKENLFGTVVERAQSTYTAYEPKFVFRAGGDNSTSSISSAESWGTIMESTTKSFEIANTGTAPLTVKSVTLPEGFTSDNAPTAEFTVAKGEKQALNITLDAANMGTFSGDLVIVYLDKDGAEQTYTLPFSATVIGANTWTADFNNPSNNSTIVYPAGSIAESGVTSDYTYSSGTYNVYATGRNTTSYATENNKFITPKLHANAGDKLAFDVKAGYSSSDDYFVKVYVSTDRQNLGEPVETYLYSTIGSSFVTKTVTFDAAGDYYVAFALYGSGSGIDNLVGLEKVDVAHDLYIKSVSWPDERIKSGTAQSKPSVDIIPLTNETADNYTVKYIYGDNEVEIASKALTASASSTTSFAASFTPEVEATTTFPGTKVVFEFTDGTKFETETFDLTVTNEPIFHFQNTKYTSRWYEPSSDYTTPYNFGKTNEAGASKTFWILNWGSAPLTVKSIAMPEGFTASVSSMTLPAFDGTQDGLETCQQSFDITFSATEAGTYSGDMVITYVDGTGADATFTLAVSGTMLDQTLWYANFGSENNQWPAGSVYQDNVSTTYVATGDYAITSSSTTKNIFVTPKLVSTGENLLFDAKLYSTSWSEGKVVVYAAATREEVLNAEEGTTRQQLFSVSGEDAENAMTTAYQTFTVQVPEGEWYLGFEISGRPYVDELYGLKLAEVEHDWTIASSNIPAEAMQNVASTATVNIVNLGLQDEAAEDITVTVYVDGEAVATGEGVAIPMNHKLTDAGTQLSVNYISNKAGTLPVYLEVKAGEYSVATDPVNVTFAEEEAKSEADMAANGTTYEVPLYLNYKNSESVTLYNAQTLASVGISAGTKIKSITYKGYKNTDVQTTSFQVYYKWTDDQTLSQPTTDYPYAAADNGMTKLIDEDHTWAKVGSSSELGDMIVLDFSDSPLVYKEGKSLCIYMHSYVDGYKAAYFEKSTLSSDYCYTRKADAATLSSSWSKAVPAAVHFALDASVAVLSGTVKTSAGAGIAGATVTLKAEYGVQYTATANESGAYTMNVIQAGLDFTATVEAEGYLKNEFAYSLEGESKTLDVTMYKTFGIVGDMPELDWNNDQVMTQSADDPNIFTLAIDNVEVATAGKYYFKLRADGKWGTYELPAASGTYTDEKNGYNVVDGNYEWEFLTAGTYNFLFTFDWTNHTLTFERPFTLSENADGVMALNWIDVTVEREFKAGWNAVVLPFALDADEVTDAFGANSELAVFDGDSKDDNGAVTVKYKKIEGADKYISAGYPYMLWLEEAVSGLKFTKNISADLTTAEGTTFDFVGVYTQTDNQDGDYIVQGGEFRKASTDNFVKPFRAYLKLKEGADPARSLSFVIGDQTVTEIAGLEVEGQTTVEGVYNLQGQKVTKMNRKGLYIINGKKVMMK